jgi:23S rRNA (guanosine2251-2'-O)-methyltransferase
MDILYGFHAVEEALKSGNRKVEYLSIARERAHGGGDARLDALLNLARARKIPVRMEPRDALTRLAQSDQHQGAVAMARPMRALALEDLLGPEQRDPAKPLFLLALDGVEDPHNLGALLRTADGAGVTGVILPERRSAPVNATVAKASSGASEHVKIARVANLNRALDAIKARNIWVLGLDERGSQTYDAYNYRSDCCLVLGREGEGLHEHTRKSCDFLLQIPMAGAVPSLNVSVAGAVVMYEAARQRRSGPGAVPAAPVKKAKPQKGLGS